MMDTQISMPHIHTHAHAHSSDRICDNNRHCAQCLDRLLIIDTTNKYNYSVTQMFQDKCIKQAFKMH